MSEMQFQWALTIIVGAVCALAVLCVILAISYAILAHRLSRRMRQTVSHFERLLQQSSDAFAQNGHGHSSAADSELVDELIPPLRIHLRSDTPPRPSDLLRKIDRWLLAHSFRFVGNFRIQHDGERLCVYLSDDQLLVASIRHASVEDSLYVEFCIDMGEQRRGGISNPPACTVQLPEDAVGRYFQGRLKDDFSLLSQMWLEAKDLVDEQFVYPVEPSRINAFYEEAHAAEMDWRIAHGGISETEIREAFAAQGIISSAKDVEAIQLRWQRAIDNHILAASRLSDRAPPAGLLVVHDSSSPAHLANQLARLLGTETAKHLAAEPVFPSESTNSSTVTTWAAELRSLLGLFPPREAIARLRPLLPPGQRYELLTQTHEPVQADVYKFHA